MKVKNVVIEVRSLKSALREFAEVYGKLKRGENVEPKFGIGFESVEGFRRVMTDKRMEVLKAIKEKSPDSIYELAGIVKRDLKSVNGDIKILKDLGLVSLEKERSVRKRVKPIVEFDRLNVGIVF